MPNTKKLTVIMSPPDFFEIQYSINPWMNLDNKVNPDHARRQWQVLHDLYLDLGLEIKIIPPVNGLPDLVFTTDHGKWIRDTFFLSRFRYRERQKEQDIAMPWYKSENIKTHKIPSICYMEGGDILVEDDHIFVGYGFRTDRTTAEYLHNTTRLPVVPLELVDEAFYHLDTCLLPLPGSTAFYYPPAFSPNSIKDLKKHFDILIPLTSSEAEGFAANTVIIGKDALCQNNPIFEQKLMDLGYTPRILEMTEFNKSGGGIHCLSQIID